MSDDRKLHPVAFHGIGTLIAGCTLPVVGGILYLAAVSAWHSLLAVGNAVSEGRIGWRRHLGWTATAALVGLSAPMFLLKTTRIEAEGGNPFLVWASTSLGAASLCFLVVGVLRIPGAIWRGVRRIVNRWSAARDRKRSLAQQSALEQERLASLRRQAEAASLQKSDQRRRIDARSKCEMAYALYAPEISERFPRAAFDQFLQTYMHDGIEVADVERRAVELQGIIEQHRRLSDPAALKKPKSLEDITRWYIEERKRIQGMDVDEEIKSVQLGLLEQRYAELSERFLTTYEP